MPRSAIRRRGQRATHPISPHKDDTNERSQSDTHQDQGDPKKELPKPKSGQKGATKAEEPTRKNCQDLVDTKREVPTRWDHQEAAAETREPLVRNYQNQGATTEEPPRPKAHQGNTAEAKGPTVTDS